MEYNLGKFTLLDYTVYVRFLFFKVRLFNVSTYKEGVCWINRLDMLSCWTAKRQ